MENLFLTDISKINRGTFDGMEVEDLAQKANAMSTGLNKITEDALTKYLAEILEGDNDARAGGRSVCKV